MYTEKGVSMEKSVQPEFKKLRELLFQRGDTYNDLAKIIGRKSQTTVLLKISGKRSWSREEMIKVQKHYSLTNEELISIFFN